MVIDFLFGWDYETEQEREEEAQKQVAMGALCVLTNHDWAHESFSLQVFKPVHRQKDFAGGYYEEYDASEHSGVTEAEVYSLVANYLQTGEPIRFSYDGQRKSLLVLHFRPVQREKL